MHKKQRIFLQCAAFILVRKMLLQLKRWPSYGVMNNFFRFDCQHYFFIMFLLRMTGCTPCCQSQVSKKKIMQKNVPRLHPLLENGQYLPRLLIPEPRVHKAIIDPGWEGLSETGDMDTFFQWTTLRHFTASRTCNPNWDILFS